MAVTFPSVAAPTPQQAESILVNTGAAAGCAMPSGGLSQIDYLSWCVGELLRNGGGSTAASVTNAITAFATGGQTSATALITPVNRVTTCATAGDSVKLPASVAGAIVTVTNSGAAACDVFPATGDLIDTLAINTAIRVAIGTTVVFVCPVAGSWFASATPLPYAKYTLNAASGAATASAGDMTGAAYVCAGYSAIGAANLTTRTATQMFADTPNARVGDSYMLLITNTSGGTTTLVGGSNVTLTGTATHGTNTTRLWRVTFTSATVVAMQSVSIGTIG